MSVVALVIAPSIAISADTLTAYSETKAATEMVSQEMKKEVMVEMKDLGEGQYQAVVTTTTTNNGEEVMEEKIFEGTMEEVKAKIEAYNQIDKNIKVKVEKVVEEVEVEEGQ